MGVVFIAVQLLSIDPDTATLSLMERLHLGRLAREASHNLPMILLMVVLMTIGVLIALNIGLRPLRRISDRAASIGPATISQRLPLRSAPQKIAPLVSAFNAALDRPGDRLARPEGVLRQCRP